MKQMAELHVLFVIFVTWIVRTPCVGMINIMGDRGRERQDSYIIHSTMEIAMQAPFSCCRCQFFAAAGLVLLTCLFLGSRGFDSAFLMPPLAAAGLVAVLLSFAGPLVALTLVGSLACPSSPVGFTAFRDAILICCSVPALEGSEA